MKLGKSVLALVAVLAVAGCDDSWETSTLPQDVKAQPVPASVKLTDIIVTQGTLPGKKYERLGALKVSVNKTTAFHPTPTQAAVVQKLREDAAKLGANAIIELNVSEVHVTGFSWGTRTGTGQAVRLVQ